jgi:hypothetical protein
LLNGGFELDADSDGAPDSWTGKPDFARSADAARTGGYSGRHQSGAGASYTLYQSAQNIAGGGTYDFSGWTNIASASGTFKFELKLEWRDASNITIVRSTVAKYTAVTGGWTHAGASVVAPAGATRANVLMQVTTLTGTIYVDDFELR